MCKEEGLRKISGSFLFKQHLNTREIKNCLYKVLFMFGVLIVRYHHEKPTIYSTLYGEIYECNHPVYDKCTLFTIGVNGLAVIQQRYDPTNKTTYWGEIDPWLTDLLYLHTKFRDFFDDRSGKCENGIYPTVTIRQIMWALKIKPIPRERWETCFDRRLI